jgi:hypothetical protein
MLTAYDKYFTASTTILQYISKHLGIEQSPTTMPKRHASRAIHRKYDPPRSLQYPQTTLLPIYSPVAVTSGTPEFLKKLNLFFSCAVVMDE